MKRIILDESTKQEIKNILVRHKSYDNFSKNKTDAYAFIKLVGIRICPYCNINYIDVIESHDKDGILRPDIDHYFNQAKYNDFELCHLNLIPSCLPCNERLKRDDDFRKIPHLHPYFHDFDSTMRFYIKLNSSNYMKTDEFDIDIIPQPKAPTRIVNRAKENIKTFRIMERYEVHKDEVVKILKNIKYYWKQRRKEISNLLNENNNTIGNGNVYFPWESILFPEKDCDINKTPLGKLKRDLINKYALNQGDN